jgi:hypothetical protein
LARIIDALRKDAAAESAVEHEPIIDGGKGAAISVVEEAEVR